MPASLASRWRRACALAARASTLQRQVKRGARTPRVCARRPAGFQHSMAIAVPTAGAAGGGGTPQRTISTATTAADPGAGAKSSSGSQQQQQQPKALTLEELAKGGAGKEGGASGGSGGEGEGGGKKPAGGKRAEEQWEDAVDEHVKYATQQELPPPDHVADVWAQ